MERITAVLILALAAACSSEVEAPLNSGSVLIEPVLSVGAETGDRVLTFGAIESMCFAPDGNIALLDRASSEVRIFSPEGGYLRTIGGQGSGPGEMNMTVYMGISMDGHLYVSARSCCNAFDYYSGEWLGEELFNGPPPISVTGSLDSTFVALKMEMVETDQGLGIETSVSRFTGLCSSDVDYRGHFFELNPADMSIFFQEGWYGYFFDVDQQGNVFLSRASDEECLVQGYSPSGELFLEFEIPGDPLPKSEDEIEEEKRFFEARFQSLGMGTMPYTPSENWNTVRSLGVDGQGRIWVQRGSTAAQLFDVYDAAGEFLFTAEMDCPEGSGSFWQFRVEPQGILGWPEDPESGWQQFHLFPLP